MGHKLLKLGVFIFSFGIVLGAFGAHGLEKLELPERSMNAYNTGVKYQFYMALFIMIISGIEHLIKERFLKAFIWTSVTGVLLFSGTLYLYAVTGQKVFAMITPLGGVSMILSGIFVFIGIKQQKASN